MKKYIILILVLLNIGHVSAQDFGLDASYPQITKPEPSVASLMRFEEIPVSNYTGIPQINVPLFELPTRSKDLSFNMSMGYHPSAVAGDEESGECGLGWSLFSGGIISRTAVDRPDEYSDGYAQIGRNDIYQFNFMGRFGRFYIHKNTDGTLALRILENINSKLVITIDYNPTTYVINSFSIYDDKGYKYLFQGSDIQTFKIFNNTIPSFSYKSAFHLTQIFDNNGKELIKFNYTEFTEAVNSSYTNRYKKTNEIIVNGYGKIIFSYSTGTSSVYSSEMRISQMELKDYNNVSIKKVKPSYLGKNLEKIESLSPDETIKEAYSFIYKDNETTYDGTFTYDDWGYKIYIPNCLYSYPVNNVTENIRISHITDGVLTGIKMPTGGLVNFDYESNSYSLYNRDANGNWILHDAPINYYTDDYPENYIVSTLLQHEFLGNGVNTYSFTVPGTGTTQVPYYFNIETTSYFASEIDDSDIITPIDPDQVYYPAIRLSGNGYYNYQLNTINNSQNLCLGELLLLKPGMTYTLTIFAHSSYLRKGKIHITKRDNKPNPSQNNYGAGIRIKRIGYFDTYVPDYYNNSAYYNTLNVFPAKEVKYSYNFFDQPNRSSGAVVFPSFDQATNSRIKREPVGYKNVTVTETGNGKKEFTYTSPMDFDYTSSDNGLRVVYYDYKRGLLTLKKEYDNNNTLLSEAQMLYDYVETPNSAVFFDNPALNERLGWAKLTQKTTKNYFSNSSLPVIIIENFTYDDNIRKPLTHSITNSLGETLQTKKTYHVGNSIYSQNRIAEVEKVETYRNTNLLSTGKINYNNTWTGNVSFLPSSTIGSKAGQALETLLNYTAYDEYSNPTEIRQQNGSFITYLWGYNKTQVIAKIENASNAQVATVMGVSNVNLITETNMTAINNLRTNAAMVAAMITTYTYIPLVGMRTLIDPKGDQMTYDYDAFNRLKAVRDKDNKILSESEYHISTGNQDFNFVKNISYKIPTDTSIPSPPIASAFQNKTFMDGLGRPIQEIAHQQASNGNDIVSHIEYDTFGRQTKNYLPYVNTTASLDYNPNAKTELLNYPDYVGQYPYSETAFEASPLGRVLEKAAPGSEWQINNVQKHTVRIDYQTNTSADAVKKLTAVAQETTFVTNGYFGISLINGGFYQSNELFKTIVKNENWVAGDGDNNTVHEFRDKEGRVVLKRTFAVSVVSGSEINTIHDIYNVYDQYGNLTYVIPPKADGVLTPTVLNNLCYQYRYDHKNRLVEKKLPGKQWEFIVYDKLNRVVAMGPTLSPFTDAAANTYGWLIAKYDALNRKILSAWMSGTTTSAGRKTLQTNYNGAAQLNESKTATNTTVNNVAFRYSNLAYPTTGYYVLTLNYYDDYNYTGAPTVFTTVMNDNSQTVYYNNTTFKPKGLVTGSWVRMVETRTMNPVKAELSHVLYDKKARVVRTRKTNYLGGYTQVDNKIDFAGKVLVTETRHKRTTEAETYIREDFSYSDQDQLVKHTHKIGLTGTPRLLSKNEYDPLGRLVTKRVGGTNITTPTGLQKIDYSYNIRGWLTGINDTNSLAQGTDPLDMFAFKINYNTVQDEYGYTGKALYNGNIAETYWKSASDQQLRKYGYKYDHLNRLKEAIYQRPGYANAVPNTFNETIKYDKNGNITNLVRTGDSDEFAAPENKIDDLTYGYATDSNSLIKVTDNQPPATSGFRDGVNLATEYTYDANGNMVKDLNKGIGTSTTNGINYNHLNLPHKILLATGNVQYWYNASGQKIKKVVTQGSTVTTTDYLDGFQYKKINAGAVTLEFFGQAEGFIMAGKYVFQYKDHLGNVRLSYTDANNDGAITTNEIVEENHYYPYGLKHSGYNNPPPPTNAALKYRYNTREWQDELGLNITAMDFRQYDNSLGRFNCIDALAEKNNSQSGYQFGNGNPNYWADPSGLDGIEALVASILHLMNELGVDSMKVENMNGNFYVTQVGGGGTANGNGFSSLGNFSVIGSYFNSNGSFYANMGSGNYVGYRYITSYINYYNTPQQDALTGSSYSAEVGVGGWQRIKADVGNSSQNEIDWNRVANGVGIGLGIKQEIWGYTIAQNYASARNPWAFANLRASQQAWRTTNTLGRFGTKMLGATKFLGAAAGAAQVILKGNEILDKGIENATVRDWTDLGVNTAGVVAAVFFASNPIGWAVGAGALAYSIGTSIYDSYNED